MPDTQSVKVALVSDVAPGMVKVISAGGKRLALCHTENNGWFAVDDLCTHDGGDMGGAELFDCEIECPRHGARFDVRTGAVTSLPAVFPIKTYPVTVADGEVRVTLP